jgi:formyl-CoA transferase
MADQTDVPLVRAGNQLPVSPAAVINTYLTADKQWLTVTSGTPRSVRNVAELLGEPASEYDTVDKQRANREHLDELLRKWVAQHDLDDALAVMDDVEVVASKIYSIQDILSDATYAEREDIITVDDHDLGPVRMQAVIPKLRKHGGHVWRTGPRLGEDNDLVFSEWLGIDERRISSLRDKGVV